MLNVLFFLLAAAFLHAEQYPWRFEGKFEDWKFKPFELVSLLLPPDPVIVEAGAFLGDDTIDMALLWPRAQIHAFEPNPRAFQRAKERLSLFTHVKMHPFALFDAAGKSDFYLCHGTYGNDPSFEYASSLLKPTAAMEIHYQGPVIQADCIRLDDWKMEAGVGRIDFLRLDAGGAELQILKGSLASLPAVRAIFVKTHFFPFREKISSFYELAAFLEKQGFILLSHWYREGLEGTAVFVSDDQVLGRTRTEKFDAEKYKLYNVGFDLRARFYIDDVPDSIKAHLRKGDHFEAVIGKLINKYANSGSIAVDIGAHIGIHTILMSRKVGPSGAVIAFEPQKKIYLEQQQNLRINDCLNVLSIRKAIGNECKSVELTVANPTNEGGTGIGSGGDIAEMIPLDSLNLQNVSLIKIDVECSELSVFEGAKETIRKNRPVIIFEVMGPYDHQNSPPEIQKQICETLDFVRSMGYEITSVFSTNDFVAYPQKREKL